MPIATDPESQRIHEAAEKKLADRMRAIGKPADAYSSEEYLDAVDEVTAGAELPAGGDLEDALAELGLTERTVTAADLEQLQTEILAERGLDRIPKSSLPKHERVDAMREAISRIGKPGEPRRDLEQAKTARKNELAVLASRAGVLNPDNVAGWMSRYDRDPEAATAELAARGVDVPGYTPPSPLRDPEYAKAAAPFISTAGGGPVLLPDEPGVRLHADAEALLASNGHRRSDGTFEYSAAEYMAAVEAVLEQRVAAETKRILTAQGLIVQGQRRYEQSDYSRAYDEATATINRQLGRG